MGQRVARLIGHTERVSAVWFSADATQLLSGSWDETLRLWDLTVLDRPVEALTQEAETRWGRSTATLFARDAGAPAPDDAP